MSVVLMYHAIFRDTNDLQRVAVEDRPYAVSEENFERQLQQLDDYRCGLLSLDNAVTNNSSPEIVITFDDGHVSNFEIALPLLVKYELTAYFFVTTDFIEQREHFCSWQQLREMNQAGMIIGSHGTSHRFFQDMSERDARHEFSQSKKLLEKELDTPVFSISFPGGRYSLENLEQARQLGFSQLFGSGFGTIDDTDTESGDALNRIPLRSGTTDDDFGKIISTDSRYYATERLKQFSKTTLKKALGNERYHALYKLAADRR